jgi:hypothetical protein
MSTIVQARLDPATKKDLDRLTKTLGCSPSEVVREALRRLAAAHPPPKRPKIFGLGKFSSGIPDLGSNKKHLEGFGK